MTNRDPNRITVFLYGFNFLGADDVTRAQWLKGYLAGMGYLETRVVLVCREAWTTREEKGLTIVQATFGLQCSGHRSLKLYELMESSAARGRTVVIQDYAFFGYGQGMQEHFGSNGVRAGMPFMEEYEVARVLRCGVDAFYCVPMDGMGKMSGAKIECGTVRVQYGTTNVLIDSDLSHVTEEGWKWLQENINSYLKGGYVKYTLTR